MNAQDQDRKIQDHAAFLAGDHDFQADIELLGASELVGTILETVMLATGMRFAGVARVTTDRWVACRTVDEINFGIAPGDEIEITSTFCQTVRDTSEMVIFSDAARDPVYREHPIAKGFGIVSYVSMPIYRANGSFFGTLCAIDTDPKDVESPRSVAMFKMFAEIIGRTLDAEERLEAQELLVAHERKLLSIKDEFVAILGHDLRNPIAALQIGMRHIGKEPVSDKGRMILSLMTASLHRMHELVENMMLHAKSRLGGGISVSAEQDAALAEALDNVVEEIRLSAPERVIELDLAFDQPVCCDPARVSQAISNLLSNAISHGAEDTPITVRGRCCGKDLTIAVSNEGEPIAQEALSTLFEPFRRGSETESAGLGLGLHIASSIAKAHNGSLSVQCQDRITTFTFTLPQLPPA